MTIELDFASCPVLFVFVCFVHPKFHIILAGFGYTRFFVTFLIEGKQLKFVRYFLLIWQQQCLHFVYILIIQKHKILHAGFFARNGTQTHEQRIRSNHKALDR